MFNIGFSELLLIFAVVLVILGPKKLPELARSAGKLFATIKKAGLDLKEALEQEVPEEIEEEVRQKLKEKQHD